MSNAMKIKNFIRDQEIIKTFLENFGIEPKFEENGLEESIIGLFKANGEEIKYDSTLGCFSAYDASITINYDSTDALVIEYYKNELGHLGFQKRLYRLKYNEEDKIYHGFYDIDQFWKYEIGGLKPLTFCSLCSGEYLYAIYLDGKDWIKGAIDKVIIKSAYNEITISSKNIPTKLVKAIKKELSINKSLSTEDIYMIVGIILKSISEIYDEIKDLPHLFEQRINFMEEDAKIEYERAYQNRANTEKRVKALRRYINSFKEQK